MAIAIHWQANALAAASYVVGVSQNNGNRFLNVLGFHTLPF